MGTYYTLRTLLSGHSKIVNQNCSNILKIYSVFCAMLSMALYAFLLGLYRFEFLDN